MSLSLETVERFWEQGYLHVPAVLPDDEARALRSACETQPTGDITAIPDFAMVVLDQRVVDVVRDLLGGHVQYWGECTARGFDSYVRGDHNLHVDARFDDMDYSRPYPLVRVGFYLQDHATHSGGVKIRPRSHRQPALSSLGIRRFVRYLMRTRNLSALRPRPTTNVPTRPGDIVIWNLRTHHAGYAIRMKLLPNLSLLPVVERWSPSFLHVPVENPSRCVIFATYGAPSEYTDKYIRNRVNHRFMKNHWDNSRLDAPEVRELAQKNHVELRFDGLANREANVQNRA